jgi:hypothetical protein
MVAFGGWAITQPGFRRQVGGGRVEFAPTQRAQEIASKDDPLTLPPRQTLLDEMIDPAIQRLANLGAEAAAAECGLLGEELAVDPGRA